MIRSLLMTLCALLVLSGCTSIQGRTIFETIDKGYVSIEAVAEETAILCGHTVVGGPCQPDAIITTQNKEDVKGRLNQAYDRLTQADSLASDGNILGAEGKAAQATAILTAIRALLAEAERNQRTLPQPETGT